jgi:hypothetical protein
MPPGQKLGQMGQALAIINAKGNLRHKITFANRDIGMKIAVALGAALLVVRFLAGEEIIRNGDDEEGQQGAAAHTAD